MRPWRRGLHPHRRGASSLELQVSFVVFSMAMVGLFPVASSYQRLGNALDRDVRYFHKDNNGNVNPTENYLNPVVAPWESRRLGWSAAHFKTEKQAPPLPESLKVVADDVTGEFVSIGAWAEVNPGDGFGGGHHVVEAGDGSQSVTWMISGLTVGRPYRVYVTWPAAEGQGTPTITSANTAKTYDPDAGSFGEGAIEAPLIQSAAPLDDLKTADGLVWQRLLNVYVPDESGQINITLHTANDGKKVVADAIRVAPLVRTATPSDPTIETVEGKTVEILNVTVR